MFCVCRLLNVLECRVNAVLSRTDSRVCDFDGMVLFRVLYVVRSLDFCAGVFVQFLESFGNANSHSTVWDSNQAVQGW